MSAAGWLRQSVTKSRAVVGLLVSLLGVLVLTQLAWVEVTLSAESSSTASVTGAELLPNAVGLVLISSAIVLTLAVAGTVLRFVLLVGAFAISFLVAAQVLATLNNPAQVVQSQVAALGPAALIDPEASLGAEVTLNVTPWIVLFLFVAFMLLTVATLFVHRSWPATQSRYARNPQNELGTQPRDAFTDWDALSAGSDPSIRDGDEQSSPTQR